MAGERDLQGIFNRVFDDIAGTLKVDVGGASITVNPSSIIIGSIDIKDATSGDPAGVTASNELKVLDAQALVELQSSLSALAAIGSTLAAIKNIDGIKKITDALPAGTNLLGKIQLSDGTLDVPVVNNGTDNAIPIIAHSAQEEVQVFDSVTDVIGASMTVAFNTGTEGYTSSQILLSSSAAATVSVFYSAGTTYADTVSDSIVFAGAGTELFSLDVPRWAKFAKLRPDNDSTLVANIFRSK